jgi:hypothetical protein
MPVLMQSAGAPSSLALTPHDCHPTGSAAKPSLGGFGLAQRSSARPASSDAWTATKTHQNLGHPHHSGCACDAMENMMATAGCCGGAVTAAEPGLLLTDCCAKACAILLAW